MNLKVFSIIFYLIFQGFYIDVRKKPNVLLILSDDQGYGDLGIHGNTLIETPVLDKLAKESAQFERFYVSPLCAPTRASLLTGRYHLRTGTVSVSKGLEIMREKEVTLAEIFKANGYQTGIFGKWHNGSHYPNHPNGQGFDEFFGFCGGHLSNYFDTKLENNGREVSTKGYITDVLAEKSLDFIDKNKNQPFFCYVPFNAPHSPHQVPDQYFNKYKAKGLDNELASIYAMCENMDDNIGKLLKKLEQLGLSENTIVIFMTDNGPNGIRFNGNMKGIKGSVDEGGVRVPCFIQWKGKIPASTIKALSSSIDILPTLQELCSIKSVKTLPLDGISLTKNLFGVGQESDRILFTHVAQPEKTLKSYPAAVRTNQYRLIIKERSTELFDMLKDPQQKNDISKTELKVTEKLKAEFVNWFADVSKDVKPELCIPISKKRNFIELPTYEAGFSGNIKYKEGHGWVHDWLVNWTSPKDSIWWDLESDEKQIFNLKMAYSCQSGEQGSEINITIGNQHIIYKIKEAFDSKVIQSPDRVPRKEVFEKEWKSIVVGKITIPKGKSKLILTAKNIPKNEVGELKSITLFK